MFHETGCRSLVALGLLAAVVTTQGGTAPASASTQPVEVSPASLGIDPAGAAVPWRVEVAASGARSMVFGDLRLAPMRPDTDRYAQSDLHDEELIAAGFGWACDVHDLEFDTARDGGHLRSAYQVDCRGVDSHRVDYRFQRSAWRGWQKYTEERIGGWVSDVTNAQVVFANCGAGGTYDYRVSSKSVVMFQGHQRGPSPAALTKKARTDCGTGVWS